VPFILIPLGLLLAIAFIPLLVLMRFRLGGARRRARRWVATLNVFMLSGSAALLLVSAAIVNNWVANAFRSAVIGLLCGALLSVFGLALTRWEKTSQALIYKPNQWFALLIPIALMVRMIYWIWRAWHAWAGSADTQSWLTASGTAGSLGVGAAVGGYYFGYALGVWRRVASTTHRKH
jgi:hypothetical protein